MRYFKHQQIAEIHRARATNIDEHSSKMGTNTEKRKNTEEGRKGGKRDKKRSLFLLFQLLILQ